jgi:hypothetical protein
MWQQILTAIITSGIITGLFQLILKLGIEHKFNLALLEATKDLELRASEHTIKLTNIFQKQAETVITIYQKLVPLYEAIYASILLRKDRNAPPDLKDLEYVNEMRRDFYQFFKLTKIYLPRETALKISGFEQTLSREKLTFDAYMEELPKGHPDRPKRQMETYDKFSKEIPDYLKSLEDDLQNLLGFPMPAKKK